MRARLLARVDVSAPARADGRPSIAPAAPSRAPASLSRRRAAPFFASRSRARAAVTSHLGKCVKDVRTGLRNGGSRARMHAGADLRNARGAPIAAARGPPKSAAGGGARDRFLRGTFARRKASTVGGGFPVRYDNLN